MKISNLVKRTVEQEIKWRTRIIRVSPSEESLLHHITSKQGIYEYVLTGNENLLNIRPFSDSKKEAKYEEQGGICPSCRGEFALKEIEGDHIDLWSEGGKTENR